MKHRVLIIGFGNHAKRIYLPVVNSHPDAEVVGIVDLRVKEGPTLDYLTHNNLSLPTLFAETTPNFSELTKFADKVEASSVIISTDPEAHVAYAKWALDKGLDLLMDKPIHAELNSAHDEEAARLIHRRYEELLGSLVHSRKKYPNIVCEILAQRRFHPAYKLIKKTINEVYKKTGCPITYYYAYHNDGQWRMPREIEDIEYHGFSKGFGKISHSGYHFYDLLNWFSTAYRDDFGINNISVQTLPNFPLNYLKQLKSEVLEKVFPESTMSWQPKNPEKMIGYGEIDAMSTVQLRSNTEVITHAQIDLQHSGISARSWPEVGNRNLYKNNGRIRHEQHYINMGPFASISLTSWQGRPFSPGNIESTDTFKPGHEFNLDVTIFRNAALIGGQQSETFNLEQIYTPKLKNYSRGHQEDARRDGIFEFFHVIDTGRQAGESSLESHALSSLIMGSAYESVSSKKLVSNKIPSKDLRNNLMGRVTNNE